MGRNKWASRKVENMNYQQLSLNKFQHCHSSILGLFECLILRAVSLSSSASQIFIFLTCQHWQLSPFQYFRLSASEGPNLSSWFTYWKWCGLAEKLKVQGKLASGKDEWTSIAHLTTFPFFNFSKLELLTSCTFGLVELLDFRLFKIQGFESLLHSPMGPNGVRWVQLGH